MLQLIAVGRTNQEIALQFVVAPGTIKAHTASIYRKLDVANRTEARATAQPPPITLEWYNKQIRLRVDKITPKL